MSRTVHLAFQDEFEEDLVIVSIDDKEVWCGDGIQTDYRISLAETVDFQAANVPFRIGMEMPRRGAARRWVVEDPGAMYQGVSFEAGEFRLTVAGEPFGYL